MVPALTGWIDKAKEKQSLIDARSVYVAAQAILDEKYASVAAGSSYTWDTDTLENDIITLSEVTGANITALTTETNSYKIATMSIDLPSGKTASLASGTWTIS